ncbi:MAG: tyrosine-type recombinase/integrase [Chloroflexaceae bacterium]|nr:tyrosine-type recombinase/integrase [Chloroflexaceae bacterium]
MTLRHNAPWYQYEATLKVRGHLDRGRARYLGDLRKFAVFVGSTQVSRITPKHLSSFQALLARDHKPSSLQVSLSALRSFFQWCIEAEHREDDPTARIPWAKRVTNIPQPLRPSFLEQMMHAMDTMTEGLTGLQQWQWQRNRRAVLLLLYTGVRISEAAALLWQDVDLSERTVTIRDDKGGKSRTIRMHEVLIRDFVLLDRYPEQAVLPSRPAGYPFKRGDLLKPSGQLNPPRCAREGLS